MTGWNITYISRTKFFFSTIIHFNSYSSRNNILSMRCLAAFSFHDRFYVFLPAPSWFKINSTNTSLTNLCDFDFAFANGACFIGRFHTFFLNFTCIFHTTRDNEAHLLIFIGNPSQGTALQERKRVHNLVRDDIGAKSRFPTTIISALKVLFCSIIIDLIQLPYVIL